MSEKLKENTVYYHRYRGPRPAVAAADRFIVVSARIVAGPVAATTRQ